MGINLSDVKDSGEKVSLDSIPSSNGLSLSDLQEDLKPVINTQHFINSDSFVNIQDCYVLDVESYALNSKVRLIQLFSVKDKVVRVWVHGKINDKEKIVEHLKELGVSILFHEYYVDEKTIELMKSFGWGNSNNHDYNAEKWMFDDFFKFIHDNPKGILGHNVSHFDLGLLCMSKQFFKIKSKVHFFSYGVGSGINDRRVVFSYVVGDDKDGGGWCNDYTKERYLVVDTMLIAFTLNEKASLHDLSIKSGSKFPKRDLGDEGYKVFENDVLEYDSVLYGVYDVLSIPDVYNYLKGIIEKPSKDFLKIQSVQSQRCVEHVWMKGSGSLAESFLSKILGCGININVPDFLTKYFGGICRVYNKNLVVAEKLKPIKYLDFTSYYPFSCRKQGIFDILNGGFEYISQKPFRDYKDKYDSMIFSSTFRIKAVNKLRVMIEGEKHKSKDKIGLGYFRSFNKENRVQDLQHQLMMGVLNRGETTILTKTELEMTKSFFPDSNFIIVEIIDALIPSSFDKSEEFIELFKVRKELKDLNNPANIGIKVLLNSCYGKLAESKGHWFNLACASAITGYCRAVLIKMLVYAKEIDVNVLYCDTDGMYLKGHPDKIRKIQGYAEKFNEHPSRFGELNLKEEDEDIQAFWGIKRKAYCKIIKKEGKNVLICKGENGNSDVRWRDVVFRLWALTGGKSDVDSINKSIENNDVSLEINLSEDNDENLKRLGQKRDVIKSQLKGLRKGLSQKQKNWVGFFEKVYPIIQSEDYGEYLADEDETSIEYNQYVKKLAAHFGFDYNIKDSNMFLHIFEKLKADYYDESQLILLLSKIGNVDLSFYLKGISDSEKSSNEELESIRIKIRNVLVDFESFAKKIYDDYKNKGIEDIFHVKSKAKITRFYNVHVKKSKTYSDGVYIKKILNEWEKKTQRDTYCGLFFSINRDYSFIEKESDELDWGLNYEGYFSQEDKIPVFSAKVYEDLLLNEIRADTIRLKCRSTISLNRLPLEDRKRITINLMTLGHVGITNKVHDLNNFALIIRLRIPENLSVNDTIVLNKKNVNLIKGEFNKSKKEEEELHSVYSNASLFITYIKQVEAVCRINKIRMFVPDRNIFNLYRFFSKLGSYLQQLILFKMSESRIVEKRGENKNRVVQGLKLDYFPRFTFISQCDIHQGIGIEHLERMHKAAFNSPFYVSSINKFIAYQLLDYLHVIGYHKKASADYKIKNQIMQDWERNVFEIEKGEEYRSEIKFKLKRNFFETLSYMFVLNSIRQEKFFDLVSMDKKRFSKKICEFKFSSWINGDMEFNEKKCCVLFNVFVYQVRELNMNEKPLELTPLLEGSWVLNTEVVTPPTNVIEEYEVRWCFEKDKIVNSDRAEEIHTEVIRDF